MSKYTCHILLILLVCILSACHHRDELASIQENPEIEFGVSNEFTLESKAAIDDTNYQQFGFIVMGALAIDSWEDDALFGENGTEVKYSASNGWNYFPKCYWQTGSYDFVGVMPSSLFAATHKYPDATSGLYSASIDDNAHTTLTLDFGTDGYNLATGQHDIMVAFDNNVDNSNGKMGTVVDGKLQQVSFAFEHQLSLVIIKAASMESRTDIRIDEIKVYGNHTSTVGDMVFNYNGSTISSDYGITGATDKDNVYQAISRPTESGIGSEYDWMLAPKTSASPTYDVLVPGLIVFPEKCNFNIVVKYTDCYGESEIQYTKTGTLPVDWEVGKKYTYTFTISLDSIMFAEPTVEPWPGTSEIFDTDIEM